MIALTVPFEVVRELSNKYPIKLISRKAERGTRKCYYNRLENRPK